MTVTASRLGSAPITIDWSNLAAVPANGKRSFAPDPQALGEAWSKLKARFDAGEVGYYNAPSNDELSQAGASVDLARQLLAQGTFTDCLFLGIGGSALGPIALLTALQEKCGPMKFHFLENPDPVDWKSTLGRLKPASTLVVAVTKSGTTFETLAQLLCALEWLGRDRWKSHLVAITDPAKGDLKAFATQEGIRTLHIAPSIGGRFSVFSPVGLFAAALAGLNVKEFLQGAQQVRDYIDKAPLEKNPLFLLADHYIQHYAKRPIHVFMPYSTRLKLVGSWLVQLWGESLGKDGKGFTPLAAVGATDQHSILQLLRDGPDDKITWFMTVDQMPDPVSIPRAPSGKAGAVYPAFKLLEGHSLQELLTVEYRATSRVLTKQNRPNLTFQIDKLDERSIGALFFALSTLTSFTGTLWGVNPFDQPGVEEGKVYIREALQSESSRPDDDENSPVARLRREHS